MRAVLVYPAGFQIRSLEHASFFLKHVLQPGTIEVPDIKDKTLYHVFVKEKGHDGRVCLGSAHYGADPLTAEIPLCDDTDIIKRTFLLRKSINRLFSKN